MDEEFYRRQRELMTKVVAESDVVITTAAVPGKKAPMLVTAEMVAAMAPGSVIVDVAAERGGNCELTRPGETVVEHGVTILGPANLPVRSALSRQPDVRQEHHHVPGAPGEGRPAAHSISTTRSSARRSWPATARWCNRKVREVLGLGEYVRGSRSRRLTAC